MSQPANLPNHYNYYYYNSYSYFAPGIYLSVFLSTAFPSSLHMLTVLLLHLSLIPLDLSSTIALPTVGSFVSACASILIWIRNLQGYHFDSYPFCLGILFLLATDNTVYSVTNNNTPHLLLVSRLHNIGSPHRCLTCGFQTGPEITHVAYYRNSITLYTFGSLGLAY